MANELFSSSFSTLLFEIFPFFLSEFCWLADKKSRDKIARLQVLDTKQQSKKKIRGAKMFLLAGKIVHDTFASTMANAGSLNLIFVN